MIQEARYIVFLLDSKFKEHDGKVFVSHAEARQWAGECVQDKYCDKFVIGMFVFEPGHREMLISYVQSFGFRGDVKKIEQLSLF